MATTTGNLPGDDIGSADPIAFWYWPNDDFKWSDERLDFETASGRNLFKQTLSVS